MAVMDVARGCRLQRMRELATFPISRWWVRCFGDAARLEVQVSQAEGSKRGPLARISTTNSRDLSLLFFNYRQLTYTT
jgi:hypothetical protein